MEILRSDHGVYVCINTRLKRYYIGSTATSIIARLSNHKSHLRFNTHHCDMLQDDWNVSNGLDFRYAVLEFITSDSRRLHLEREQFYIERYRLAGKVLYNTNNASDLAGVDAVELMFNKFAPEPF